MSPAVQFHCGDIQRTLPMTDAPRKAYRLLTGPDTAEFCLRVSGALQEGYRLWGGPVMTLGPDGMVVGQAVVLSDYLEAPKAESR